MKNDGLLDLPFGLCPTIIMQTISKKNGFPGVHSDVGGGYADSGLADIALEWMTKNGR